MVKLSLAREWNEKSVNVCHVFYFTWRRRMTDGWTDVLVMVNQLNILPIFASFYSFF